MTCRVQRSAGTRRKAVLRAPLLLCLRCARACRGLAARQVHPPPSRRGEAACATLQPSARPLHPSIAGVSLFTTPGNLAYVAGAGWNGLKNETLCVKSGALVVLARQVARPPGAAAEEARGPRVQGTT